MPLSEAGVEVPGSLEEAKVDGSVGFASKVTVPVAARLHPVLGTEAGSQQRDAKAAHEEGDEDEGALLEVHGGLAKGSLHHKHDKEADLSPPPRFRYTPLSYLLYGIGTRTKYKTICRI